MRARNNANELEIYAVAGTHTVVPLVISGSANYSVNSTTKNDENTLIIKNDTRVVDIYFTEFVRLFDHFSFREWLKNKKAAFKPFLDEKGQWINKYFDSDEYLSVKRKKVFKNMAISPG